MTSATGRSGSARARDRVAVIGSGVAGLTAAYLLQRRYDVALYEADGRLGGHAHTHDVLTPDTGTAAIDSGFIVHNARTYPHLIRLFRELDVETQPTEMSMSVRCEGCGLEYAGAKGVGGVLARPSSAVRPAYVRMLARGEAFPPGRSRGAVDRQRQLTLGRFLADGRYSSYFCRHFIVPLVACVWSTSQEAALGYPARYLFAFLDNHGMLTVSGSPQWRTVVGGSDSYVQKAVKEPHVGTPYHRGAQHPPRPRRSGRYATRTTPSSGSPAWWSRRTPTPRCAAGSGRPARESSARYVSHTPATTPCCTPIHGCSRARVGPGHRGTT